MSEHKHESYTTSRPDVFAMVPSNAMSILDVGCSNGALGASLRKAVVGRHVTGIESDDTFVAEARHKLDKVIQADLNVFNWEEQMPLRSFDCIIFADVLEHLLDPRSQLMKAKKLLAPNGSIVISLPNIRHISGFMSIYIHGKFPQRDRGIFDRTHLRWFTITDVRRLAKDLGMRVEEESYNLRIGDQGGGILNRIADIVLNPVHRFYPIREFLTYQFCLRFIPI